MAAPGSAAVADLRAEMRRTFDGSWCRHSVDMLDAHFAYHTEVGGRNSHPQWHLPDPGLGGSEALLLNRLPLPDRGAMRCTTKICDA